MLRKKFTMKEEEDEDSMLNSSHSPYITELDLKLLTLDLVVSEEWLHPFVKMITPDPVTNIVIPDKVEKAENLNTISLPLLYFKSKTLRLFLPHVKDESKTNEQIESVDLVMVEIDEVNLSSQVENPLPRVIVRQDIYNMAEQARITQIPGSAVEDRQYQLDVTNLSVSTGM